MPAEPGNPSSDGADSSGPSGAPLTAAERKVEAAREKYRRQRRLVRLGQVLMVAGALVAIIHVFAHLEMFGAQPSGMVDLLAGYPMAALLFVAGAIMAGQ